MSTAVPKLGWGLMQETLRMFPPVAIGQARIVSADLSVGSSLHLPTGTCAIVPHHAMHSSSLNWDKPNEFLPGEQSPHSSGPSHHQTGAEGHSLVSPGAPKAQASVAVSLVLCHHGCV